MIRLGTILTILFALSGCASASTLDSATGNNSPTFGNVPAPAPSPTPRQPFALPTLSSTLGPVLLETITPAPQTATNVFAPTPGPRETWSFKSPDGVWIATGFAEFPPGGSQGQYHTQLSVSRTDGTVSWILVDTWLPQGLGYTTPQPLQWSSDGRFLYFADLPHVQGCAPFVNGEDMYRANLSNGQIRQLLPNAAWVVSVAPDDKTLAYIEPGNSLKVHLLDIASGSDHVIQLDASDKDVQAGSMVWSPDSAVLILTMAVHPCNPATWLHSIIRIDVPSLTTKLLVHDDRRYMRTIRWRGNASVEIDGGNGNGWLIDAVTGSSPTR